MGQDGDFTRGDAAAVLASPVRTLAAALTVVLTVAFTSTCGFVAAGWS